MQSGPTSGPHKGSGPAECRVDTVGRHPAQLPGSAWPSTSAEQLDAKQRLSHLALTIEQDIIPRLVGAHRVPPAAVAVPSVREIELFVKRLEHADEAEVAAMVGDVLRRGASVESLFLDLLAPAARLLGWQWEQDRCDFSTVTVCLGRLQRLLREWSPQFGREVAHPSNGRRVLLGQHPDEQHSFGLSMVAEFFRRDGWEVLGGVGGSVPDPSAQVSRDWFDAVGFSIGSQTRVDWLRERIAQVRTASRNRAVVVLVGGPLLTLNPAVASAVGADGFGQDGGQAPQVAENLLTERLQRR